MSLVSNLKRFLETFEKETTDLETKHIEQLENFIKKFKSKSNEVLNDTEIIKIVNDLRNITETILKGRQIATYAFDFMKDVNEDILKKWIELDSKERTFHTKMIYNICIKEPNNTQYIIWLINKGFYVDEWGTASIAESGNLELLLYYHERKIGFTPAVATMACKNGYLDILKFCYEIGFIAHDHTRDISMSFMVIAFENNHTHILEYLKTDKELNFVIELTPWRLIKNASVEELLTQFKITDKLSKIKNTTLLWLYSNGYKWTKKFALEMNNPFMMSFFD
jgi:hypothetical protein